MVHLLLRHDQLLALVLQPLCAAFIAMMVRCHVEQAASASCSGDQKDGQADTSETDGTAIGVVFWLLLFGAGYPSSCGILLPVSIYVSHARMCTCWHLVDDGVRTHM